MNCTWTFIMFLPSYRTEARAVFQLHGPLGTLVRERTRTGYTRDDAQTLVDHLNWRADKVVLGIARTKVPPVRFSDRSG